MRGQKYYTLKVRMVHADGREQTVRYCMTREQFNTFFNKCLAPEGSKVISIEDIKEPVKYYS